MPTSHAQSHAQNQKPESNLRTVSAPETGSLTEPSATRFQPAKVLLALPAYNEQASLPELMERIGEAFADSGHPYEVIIVDDGSQDDTLKIACQWSFQMPVHVLQHKQNQGLGVTIRDALREATDRAGERDIIVTMDADNTHPPGLIDRMVRTIGEGCDVVIASRFQNGARVIGVPFNRAILSIGARLIFTLIFPTRGVRDYTSGYRAYRAASLRQAFDTFGDDFVAERGFSCMSDILLKLRSQGCMFGEVPLRLRYDQKGGESKMQVFKTIGLTLTLLARRRLAFLSPKTKNDDANE
ncbi:Undecaprenyl-phosphate mannosyltransferase [Roseimaritima multifibrata]|uniref:Undecaprenyl-phosphate mannosyltransferase n=1 Tax=Roseimaritima multifibrata TaxID=1930274 RepID=A0A517ME76_9BACT|nr:glycosyltransferase [Roseimaritima multifibrata]QDS93190.1 Undecaprenyl-phosphate mannosyltransferase [Roseimaritima multifibrata]